MMKLINKTDIYGDLGLLVEGGRIWDDKKIEKVNKNILLYGNVLTLFENSKYNFIGFQTPCIQKKQESLSNREYAKKLEVRGLNYFIDNNYSFKFY